MPATSPVLIVVQLHVLTVSLQAMFHEKHGRDATEEEVALWMEAVGSLSSKLDGLSVEDSEEADPAQVEVEVVEEVS
jgi:hypothetical protein